MKMAALPQVFNILLNQLFCVNTIIDDNWPELHLVWGEGACFIS
jgi:hypothetical protein